MNGAYYRDNRLAQKLLSEIFWISQGRLLSVDRTAPRRFDHATLSLSWSERYSTSFLKHFGHRIHRILTQSTIASVVYCRTVYRSRIANVVELETLLFDERERFVQSIVEAAIEQWRRRLSPCVRVSGAHFERQFKQAYKFKHSVIYLPKVIKLVES